MYLDPWGEAHRFETVGIDASMSHDARQHSPAGREPLIVEPGREDDLSAITDILNYTIMNSNATLATEPVTVDERRVLAGLRQRHDREVPLRISFRHVKGGRREIFSALRAEKILGRWCRYRVPVYPRSLPGSPDGGKLVLFARFGDRGPGWHGEREAPAR
jgi:hypothetical protein